MTDIDSVWVISDVAPDGTYVVGIQAGADTARMLNRDEAITYATTVMAAAARAEHDAAVIAQLGTLGIGIQDAAELVADLRADRPPLDPAATAPFGFEPIVAAKREPAILLSLNGERVGQWTTSDAKGHAAHVLEVVAGVDLDAAYRRLLVGVVGLDDRTARAVVGDLGRHRKAVS